MKPESNTALVIDDGEDATAAAAPSDTPVVVVEGENGDELGGGELPARAVLNDDGSVTLALVKPIVLRIKSSANGKEREETYRELVFHELTGLDLRLAAQESDDMKRTIVTMARATRMTTIRMNVLFDRLAQRDVKGATDVIAYFQE